MSKLTKKIIHGEEVQRHIAAGISQVYEVAKASYGPSAGNALIELPYGDPLISRDGVTNVEKIYLEEPTENMAGRLLVQAARKNNKKVGDGTTAVIILAYHLYKKATELVAAGQNQMEVSRILQSTAADIIAQLDKMKVPANDAILQHVARVSAGDEAIGSMIADVIKEVGTDGGVTVEDFAGLGIYNELVDGFYFRKGFTNVNLINDPTSLESRHIDADILITEKRMATPADIAPILENIVAASGLGKDLVLVGDVSEEVMGMLLLNRMKAIINVTPVDLPIHGSMRSLALEDLALVTGGKVYVQGANPSDFDITMLGAAEKVIINEFSTTIIGGESAAEDVSIRVAELHKQLGEADSTVTTDALKERLARLTGKVAIIRVGGATEVEQKEVKLRVEDSVCAVQAAIKDGVVPGGGVALARVAPLSLFLVDVFNEPFNQLVENAGYSADKALWTMLAKKNDWFGYDLTAKDFAYKPVDLMEAGIIDPTLVVKEVVQNATSIIAKLITVKPSITIANRDEKHD